MKQVSTSQQQYEKIVNKRLLYPALAANLVATMVMAQSDLVSNRPRTLAPAATTSSGGGGAGRADVNRTFLEPFASFTTKTFTSFGANTESNYDWKRSQWLVPINVFVQQMLKAGKRPIALQLGGRYYAQGPSGAPEWGLRFQVSFLFPKNSH